MGKWLKIATQHDELKKAENQTQPDIDKAAKQGDEKVNQKPVDNIIKLNTLATLNDYDIMIGDTSFVNKMLFYKPKQAKESIIDEYCKIWIDTYNEHKADTIKRGNIARVKANTWLRTTHGKDAKTDQ